MVNTVSHVWYDDGNTDKCDKRGGRREGRQGRETGSYAANRSPLHNYLYSSAGHTPRISHDSSNTINKYHSTNTVVYCIYTHFMCTYISENKQREWKSVNLIEWVGVLNHELCDQNSTSLGEKEVHKDLCGGVQVASHGFFYMCTYWGQWQYTIATKYLHSLCPINRPIQAEEPIVCPDSSRQGNNCRAGLAWPGLAWMPLRGRLPGHTHMVDMYSS